VEKQGTARQATDDNIMRNSKDVSVHANTCHIQFLLLFHGNNCYVNALQYYVIHTLSVLFIDIPSYNLPNASLKISNLQSSFLIPLQSPAVSLGMRCSYKYPVQFWMQYLCCHLQIWLYQIFATVANFHAISLAFCNGHLLYFGNIKLDYCTARSNTFFQVNTTNVKE